MSLYLWTLIRVVRCVKCFSLETETSCPLFLRLKDWEDLTQRGLKRAVRFLGVRD